MKTSGTMHVETLRNTYLEAILEKAIGECFEFIKITELLA